VIYIILNSAAIKYRWEKVCPPLWKGEIWCIFFDHNSQLSLAGVRKRSSRFLQRSKHEFGVLWKSVRKRHGHWFHRSLRHILFAPFFPIYNFGFAQAWTAAQYSRHSQRTKADHLTGWVEFPPSCWTGAKGSPRQTLEAAAALQRASSKYCRAKNHTISCANQQALCKCAHNTIRIFITKTYLSQNSSRFLYYESFRWYILKLLLVSFKFWSHPKLHHWKLEAKITLFQQIRLISRGIYYISDSKMLK